MNKLQPTVCIVAFLLLAGCSEQEASSVNLVVTNTGGDANVLVPAANAEPAPAANETVPAPALNIAPDGVSLVTESGSARHATFGMARDVAVPMVSAALGKPADTGHNADCGQGPMDTVAFKGGLTMFFMEGKFVGWDLDDKSTFSTAAGIGIGSTLKDMREVMTVTLDDQSTLGHEFAAGEMAGLLSAAAPTGKVTALWAGSVCQFR